MKLVYTLTFLLAVAAIGHAKPMRITFDAAVSGYLLGGTSLHFDSYVYKAVVDTENRYFYPNYETYAIPFDTAEIDLGEAGKFSLPRYSLWESYGEIQKQNSWLSFQYATHQINWGIYNWEGVSIQDTRIGAWDMKSSFGPITVMSESIGHATTLSPDINSNGPYGTFRYKKVFPVTFTAIVTPEPSAILLAAGSPLLLMCRRIV